MSILPQNGSTNASQYPYTPVSKNPIDQTTVSGGIVPQQSMQSSSQYPPVDQQSMQRSQSALQQPNGGITYPQAAMASHLMGLGQPKIIDVNGQQIAVTPFGNIPVAQGLTPQQEALQKGLGKYAAQFYGDNVTAYQGMQRQSIALENLADAVENSPEFENVTGPIGSFLTKWSGSPAEKELLGRLKSSSGEIALQVAPSLKGAFTGRDQQLINSIKASPNDFRDVFIGKLKAQTLINDVLQERARLAANYVAQGMSPLDAADKAAKETPLSKYKPIVDKLIKGNDQKMITIVNPKTKEKKTVTIGDARAKYGVKI
jgi:hypothetical protein